VIVRVILMGGYLNDDNNLMKNLTLDGLLSVLINELENNGLTVSSSLLLE
jgi:hypothetical protein